MEPPPLTILIPTHGRPTLLKRTLDSLAQCVLTESYEELVVIENGSRVGAKKVVASLPPRLNARYMNREQGNKSFALNEALNTIRGGLVVFFDDDVRVHPDVLVRYAEVARGVEKGVFFGGPTDVDYEQPPPAWLLEYLPPSAKGWATDGEWENEDFNFFLGFNWAAFAADLEMLGGFDNDVGPGTSSTGQETDMQKRLLSGNVKQQFVPGAKVWHYVPKERCSPAWALKRQYRNAVTDGFQEVHDDVSLFGIPCWTFKETARSLYMAVRDTVKRRHVDAFASWANVYRYIGIMRGAFAHAKQSRVRSQV